MIKGYIAESVGFLSEFVSYLPPGLVVFAAAAFLNKGQFFGSFRHEFIGTLLMVGFTFSAGKWVGQNSLPVAWTSHAIGVIAADFFGGGPHVNPAVTFAMWALGKCSYTEGYVRIAGQLAGGLVAFPLYHTVSHTLNLTPFGGPEFHMEDEHHAAEAFMSEFMATALLMWVIYLLNWELNFGEYHYIIKQSLTAAAIRALIQFFPTAGPAMNPMLATAWHVFGVGKTFEYPDGFEHYFVYWVAPFLGGLLGAVTYTIYAGGTVFGRRLPIGPFKKQVVKAAKKKN